MSFVFVMLLTQGRFKDFIQDEVARPRLGADAHGHELDETTVGGATCPST